MTTIFPDWHSSQWHAVDDRVRGGSSQSHLDAVPVDGVKTGDEKRSAARFWGTLDTKTLGGAGFASRKYQFGPEPLSLPRAQYRGVILRVLPSHSYKSQSHAQAKKPDTFTVVFKTQLSAGPPSKPKVPPSPDPASLSYEAQFTSPSASTSSSSSSGNTTAARDVELSFDDFVPTYRGRPVSRDDPKYKPFDPASIYEISLMCRSDFGKQEGEFELVVESVSGWEQRSLEREGGRARDGCWSWVKGWFMSEGQVTLGNAEK